MTKLKPCPFCGGKAEIGIHHCIEGNKSFCYEFIYCRYCFMTTEDYSKGVIANMWNRRVKK